MVARVIPELLCATGPGVAFWLLPPYHSPTWLLIVAYYMCLHMYDLCVCVCVCACVHWVWYDLAGELLINACCMVWRCVYGTLRVTMWSLTEYFPRWVFLENSPSPFLYFYRSGVLGRFLGSSSILDSRWIHSPLFVDPGFCHLLYGRLLL